MKVIRLLTTERHADRRCSNAGNDFRQPNGWNGYFVKLFHAAVTRGHHALLTGIQKVSGKICASVRIPPIPCPAYIWGELHAERQDALPSDACQMAHSATVCASHHYPTGNCKMSRRLTTWAPLHLQLPGPSLGLRKGNLSKSMEIQFYGPKTDTAGEYISTNQQPVTIATIIHIIVRLFFTRERKLL